MSSNSLNYRIKRMSQLKNKWELKFVNDLMLEYKIPKELNYKFKFYLKNYISKALNFDFEEDDDLFLKKVDKNKTNRTNVTPNGAVVPKREYNLEYNLFLKVWCELIANLSKNSLKTLRFFRMTPNIRIKYAKDFKDNVNRDLNTSHPHSDAWVEGPWGMNCFIPIFGDTNNNNLKFYYPRSFEDNFLDRSPSYKEMQWVMKNYRELNFKPKKGCLYISDYALVHNTMRNKHAGSRISVDSTIFTDKKNNPPKSRIKEYRTVIPKIGESEIVDAGQYAFKKFAEKKGIYSHYTSKVLRSIKL